LINLGNMSFTVKNVSQTRVLSNLQVDLHHVNVNLYFENYINTIIFLSNSRISIALLVGVQSE
jgi:hypothetical protein